MSLKNKAAQILKPIRVKTQPTNKTKCIFFGSEKSRHHIWNISHLNLTLPKKQLKQSIHPFFLFTIENTFYAKTRAHKKCQHYFYQLCKLSQWALVFEILILESNRKIQGSCLSSKSGYPWLKWISCFLKTKIYPM